MKKSSLSSKRGNRRSTGQQKRTSMNTTIDLTNDDSFSSNISTGSDAVYHYRPSTSFDPEIIDLSTETDAPPRSPDFCLSDLLETEDDLPPPPKIPALDQPKHALSCPICFGDMSEASSVMTTKCGHMFCKECILDSLKVKSMCPMCRKKVLKSQLVVVYLNPTIA